MIPKMKTPFQKTLLLEMMNPQCPLGIEMDRPVGILTSCPGCMVPDLDGLMSYPADPGVFLAGSKALLDILTLSLSSRSMVLRVSSSLGLSLSDFFQLFLSEVLVFLESLSSLWHSLL